MEEELENVVDNAKVDEAGFVISNFASFWVAIFERKNVISIFDVKNEALMILLLFF